MKEQFNQDDSVTVYHSLPSIVSSNSPDTNCMDGLSVKDSEILWIYQLQCTFIQVHE